MSENIYQAIYKFAPDNIKSVANNIFKPSYLRNLEIIKRKPKYISKLSLKDAIELIENTSDLNFLADLITSNDKRLKFNKAIRKHKRYNQAKRVAIHRSHPYKDIKKTELFEFIKLDIIDNFNKGNNSYKLNIGNNSYENLITFLRNLPTDQKSYWYEKIYNNLKEYIFTGELEIDILTQRDINLNYDNFINDSLKPYNEIYKINHITAGTLNQILSYYTKINLPLAKVVKENSLKLDLALVDDLDDDSLLELISTQSSVQLFEKGLVKDSRLLLPIISDINPGTRCKLAAFTQDPEVFEALLEGMYYRSKFITCDIGKYIDQFPEMSTKAKIIVLSHCSKREFTDFLNNRYINKSNEDEIKTIIDSFILGQEDKQYGWYISSIEEFIQTFSEAYLSDLTKAGIYHLLEIIDNKIPLLLADEGNVGKLSIDMITKEIGSDEIIWDNLIRLSKDWNGNLNSLIMMVKKL